MKKQLFFLFLVILLIGIGSAETFRQGVAVDFVKTCTNSTDYICSTSASCNLTIKNPINNTRVVDSAMMTNNNNGLFNYTINATKIFSVGNYNWDMFCCDGKECGEDHGTFRVTTTGVELSQEKALIYLGMLAILVLLFVLNLIAIPLIPSKNKKDEQGFFVAISNLKYVRCVLYASAWGILIGLMFISSSISFLYLESTLMADIFFNAYRILMALTLPGVFLWFILIFVNVFRDKEMKSLIERGVSIRDTP